MFIENKYSKIYFKIINRAKQRDLTGSYSETHHIIPRCLGGSDNKNNLAVLTAREHFICHWLLTKMTEKRHQGLSYAFILMVNYENNKPQRKYQITSKVYEISKKLNAEVTSERFKGKQKHNVGKRRYYDPETGKCYMLTEEEIKTTLLTPGTSKALRENLKSNCIIGKGVYAYNDLGEVKRFKSDSDIPEGWTKGNPNAATRNATDTILIHNDETQKRIPKDSPIPEGWKVGSCKIWSNDGTKNMQCNFNAIPEGWMLGKVHKPNLKKTYHDPITDVEKQFTVDNQPEGWVLGRSNKTKQKLSVKKIGDLYYDPTSESQKRIKSVEDIPDGWLKGTNPRITARNPGNRKKEKYD